MPHRFKRARAVARSRAPPYSVHSGHPLATCSPHSELATSSEDMDHIRTPCKRPGARNPRPMKRSDVRQTSQKTQMAWKGEIAGRIIPITNPVEDFLDHFVPGEKPASNVGYTAFEMPKNPTKESDMYAPLVSASLRRASILLTLSRPPALRGWCPDSRLRTSSCSRTTTTTESSSLTSYASLRTTSLAPMSLLHSQARHRSPPILTAGGTSRMPSRRSGRSRRTQ